MFRGLIILFLLIPSGLWAQDADRILGLWQNEARDKVVEIYKADGKYHGRIHWLKEPKNPDGSWRRDVHNNKPERRSRLLLGIDVFKNFTYNASDGEWDGGEIYSEYSGNTYNAKMWLNNNGELRVKGYLGFLWFLGRTNTYYRKY
ncbi:MAG: DUF2147 domain-containing protein [Flavobacteriales bacterium]|nr:DUF2147 domain-containing protein [Flavobacteriales bacterium]